MVRMKAKLILRGHFVAHVAMWVLVLHPADAGAQMGVMFSPATNYSMGFEPNQVEIGDFDLDGKPDLVCPNALYEGYVTARLGNGDGTFGTTKASTGGCCS